MRAVETTRLAVPGETSTGDTFVAGPFRRGVIACVRSRLVVVLPWPAGIARLVRSMMVTAKSCQIIDSDSLTGGIRKQATRVRPRQSRKQPSNGCRWNATESQRTGRRQGVFGWLKMRKSRRTFGVVTRQRVTRALASDRFRQRIQTASEKISSSDEDDEAGADFLPADGGGEVGTAGSGVLSAAAPFARSSASGMVASGRGPAS